MKDRGIKDCGIKLIDQITDQITLHIVQIGTDKTNFKILKMAKEGNDETSIDKMMKELNLAKVPINVRVNKLEKFGFINRLRGTGKVILTDFGKDFIQKINTYQNNIIRGRLMDMLKRISE